MATAKQNPGQAATDSLDEAAKGTDLPTVFESQTSRHSPRLEAQKLTGELMNVIEAQSHVHVALLQELEQTVDFRRLCSIRETLLKSAEHVNTLFEHLRKLSDSPKSELLKEIDRLARDRKIISDQVELLMSELSAKPKSVLSDVYEICLTEPFDPEPVVTMPELSNPQDKQKLATHSLRQQQASTALSQKFYKTTQVKT